MYRLSGERTARSSSIANRTLTTAYKEKDTDNIKRVKSKVYVSKIQTAIESLRKMKCLVINLKRTGQDKETKRKESS